MKTLLVTLGLFIGSLFGNIAQAAPTDCIGMGIWQMVKNLFKYVL